MTNVEQHRVVRVEVDEVRRLGGDVVPVFFARRIRIYSDGPTPIHIVLFADTANQLILHGVETPTDAEIDDRLAEHEPETVNGQVVGGEE